MKPHLWFASGAMLAALAVANGAFSAHGLRERLTPIYQKQLKQNPDAAADVDVELLLDQRMAAYDAGVRYHMYHSIGLMLLGLAAVGRKSTLWDAAGFGFFAGVVLFSGMLYLLVFTNNPSLGKIVPIGGLLSIIGWVVLGIAGWRCLAVQPSPPQNQVVQ